MHIHCRSDKHRRLSHQHGGAEHVICDAVGHFADHVGRSRGNDDQIRAVRHIHMGDDGGIVFLKGIHNNVILRQRLKGKRLHQLGCGFRHDDTHLCSRLHQLAAQGRRLIRRNSSAHTQNHRFSLQHIRSPPSEITWSLPQAG
ncbi:hypothetical protein D3C75_843920 [compost metagenome]